jgi:hypothetical protein
MGKVQNKLIATLSLAGLIVTAPSCTEPDRGPANNERQRQIQNVVYKIMEEAGVKSNRFFLVSPDVCLTCLDDINVTYGELEDYLDFIVVGGESGQVRLLNAIYGRQRLRFTRCSKMLWDKLAKIDKRYSMGVFLGVKRGASRQLMVYDGFDLPAPQRINAVLQFCRK